MALRGEIYSKPQTDWCIADIARRLKLSDSYVQHLYKIFFGTSIISDVTSSRIEYAKYLLTSTDMTVSSVAELCGYRNDVHFMRVFKDSAGATPTDYRKSYKK